MRRLFTGDEAGLSRAALRWGEQKGRWRRLDRDVFGEGPEPASELDAARARVLALRTVGRGTLAGVAHGLDGIDFDGRGLRRAPLPGARVVRAGGIPVADGLTTLVDLAAVVGDVAWEQALESALRKRLVTVVELEAALPDLGRSRTPGVARMQRVLALRPPGAAPTESLLETLMVQLAREVDGLGDPVRQYEVVDDDGNFVGLVDVCWPRLGLFLELDGQHHHDQPVYDARWETAIIAATGWLVGRFTWYEVVHLRRTTIRRLAALADQARRRPLIQAS